TQCQKGGCEGLSRGGQMKSRRPYDGNSGGCRQGGLRRYSLDPKQRRTERANEIAIGGDVHLHAEALLDSADDSLLARDAADEGDLAIHADALQELAGALGQRFVNSAQDVFD